MAAGGSKRLGRAKQLLPFKDGFLLEHTIKESVASNIGEVFVVLGAYQKEIYSKLQIENVQILLNENWEEGLSSSIAFGISKIASNDLRGVVIVLADQLYFHRNILVELKKLIEESKNRIIISTYKKGSGPPSFFDASLFSELMDLKGDLGAKEIVKKYKSEVAKISFEKGYLDIDEKGDLKLLEEFDKE